MKKCPDCNSENIIENVRLIETDRNIDRFVKVAVDESPDALFFKERNYSEIIVKVCADCGLIQQYASQPKILLNAYQNQQKKQK